MIRCNIHRGISTEGGWCWKCEEEKLILNLERLSEMTMNKDLGTSIIHTKENTRLISKTDSVVDSIIDQFITRAQFGKMKYKTDLDREDLSVPEWIEHAQQELMDGILYLEKLKKILGGRK